MSKKYVIEIKSEYEDTIRGIMVLGAKDSNLYMDALEVEDMEELTSDYINKHYGSLQDDAYQRGLEDCKQTTVGAAELREKLEYQKGFEKGKDVRIKGCEGCMYQDTTIEHNPCNLCCNAFLNRWTAKSPIDDGFVRGDVVVDERDGTRGIVVSSENNESNLLYVLFKGYRVPQSVVRKHYKKTGEHYDIDKFLDEVKGEGSK